MRVYRYLLPLAVLLPLGVLVILALRTWRLEVERVELLTATVGEEAVEAVGSVHQAFLRGEALPGEWRGELVSPPAELDHAHLELLRAELDTLLLRGQRERALERLVVYSTAEPGSDQRLWALLAQAGLLMEAGMSKEARDLWRAVEREGAASRDARGVRRDLVARTLLYTDDVEGLTELLADAAQDWTASDQLGTAALVTRILNLAEQLSREGPELVTIQRVTHDLEAGALEREWRALLQQPALQQTAPGAFRSVQVRRDPMRAQQPTSGGNQSSTWVALRGAGASVRGLPRSGWAMALVEDPAVASLSAKGVRVAVLDREGERLAGWVPKNSTLKIGAGRLEGTQCTMVAYGADLSAWAAGERRRSARTLWLVSGALALALFSGGLGLVALRRESRRAEERRGFVAAVTHELKTPLASTRLLGELLERGGVEEPKVREFGGRIAAESQRLATLVHGVLDLSRLERIGLTAGELERVEVQDLLEEAASRAHLPGERLVIDTAGHFGMVVMVDREALLGALSNLIENADGFGPEGSAVELGARSDGQNIVLEVRDRGPGVPRADRQRIFEAFTRLESENTPDRKGTGLGLALVARIARASGGIARYRPRSGGGSVFEVELPRDTGGQV